MGGILQELLSQGLCEPPRPKLPASESITDPALIEARVRALVANRAPAFVRMAAGTIRGRAVPLLDDGAYPLQIALEDPDTLEFPFELELIGYNSIYRFPVTRGLRVGGPGENRVAIPLPARLVRLQHRASRRAEAPPECTITFQHPAFPDLRIHRPVRDLSFQGLCFDTRLDQDMIRAGLHLRDVVITAPGGDTMRCDADVRVVFPAADGRGAGCGVQLQLATPGDRTTWQELVGSTLHPSTRLGGTWSEDSWDLYTASGYFSLSGKSQPHFALLKAPFASVTRKVDAAPNVGCQVAWPSERGVEASLSLLKIYEHTWFGFQMAKLPGAPADGASGREVLRDIHLRAYEHAQNDPNLRWTMGLVQASARWSKLVHYDLPVRYLDSGLACTTDFHALQFDVPDRLPAAADTAAIGLASATETARLLDGLRWRRPWVYREALDLVPERFELGGLCQQWQDAGLTRERALLVARQGGQVVAAAVVESADPGLHLFGLLDVVRLYPTVPAGLAAFDALLDAAAAWYAARGRTQFTCLLEDGPVPDCAHLAPRDLGRGTLTLLSTELIPSFLEHVSEVTAPRLPRD
jgi:hypothetical protein